MTLEVLRESGSHLRREGSRGIFQDYGPDPAAGSWHLLYAHVHPPAPWLALLDWPEAAGDLLGIRVGAAVDARVQQALGTPAPRAWPSAARSCSP